MTVGMYGGKFYPFHMGHLSMILKAASQVDELYVVISYSEERERLLSKRDGFPYLPLRLRLRWITESVKDLANVFVKAVKDHAEDDETYDWAIGATDIKNAIGKPIDIIFGSEESYRAIFSLLYPSANYVCIDPERSEFPISATAIRRDGAFNHWQFLPESVRPFFLKRIAIVGTESCGKSTVTSKLAAYFSTCSVKEYGRTYTDAIGGSDGILFHEDFLHIACQHKVDQYQQSKHANKFLFVDSEAIVTQYYSLLYGEGYNPSLEAIIQQQQFDLILFLEPDVPWVQDGTRHHGEAAVRLQNNDTLKNLFTTYETPFVSISGNHQERFERCIAEVKKLSLFNRSFQGGLTVSSNL